MKIFAAAEAQDRDCVWNERSSRNEHRLSITESLIKCETAPRPTQISKNLEIDSKDQLTKRRMRTLMAKPMAINVASTEDNPALIKGSGTPITGSSPTAIPTLMKI